MFLSTMPYFFYVFCLDCVFQRSWEPSCLLNQIVLHFVLSHVPFYCLQYGWLFIFPYGSFFSNSQQLHSREMKHRKADRIVKYLKLKQMNPSIELRELVLDRYVSNSIMWSMYPTSDSEIKLCCCCWLWINIDLEFLNNS